MNATTHGGFIVLTAILLATTAIAAEPRTYEMRTYEDVWAIAYEDITGNGWKEILAFGRNDDSESLEKYLSVFIANSGVGGFPEEPTFRLTLPEDMGVAFFARTRHEGQRDLILANGEEFTVLRYDGETFVVVDTLAIPSLLPTSAARPAYIGDLVHDLTGDGLDEWLLPVAGGFNIVHADGRIVHVKAEVASGLSGTGGMRVSHRMPEVIPYRTGDSGPYDLAFLGENFIDFAMGPDWQTTRRITIPDSGNERARKSPQVKDVNGNGLPDVIVTEGEGNLNIRMQTMVWYAEAPGVYPEKPSRVFEARGAYAEALFADVDGNGRLDVAYVQIPVNVNFFINYFLRQRVSIQVEVYMQDETGFQSSPDMRSRINITAPDDEELAYTLGDFNGDGRLDIAFGQDDVLEVYIGETDRFISRRPWVAVDIPPFGSAKAVDLTGNGRDDIVLARPSQDKREIIRVVLF
jgi:hypothetical protein